MIFSPRPACGERGGGEGRLRVPQRTNESQQTHCASYATSLLKLRVAGHNQKASAWILFGAAKSKIAET